jgi:hypothetical protein
MMEDLMYQALILKSLKARIGKAYTPKFHVRREERGWRVFDGQTAIALFTPLALDIWAFSPFEPPILANTDPPDKVWDLYTMHNTYLNLGFQTWPRHWQEQTKDAERLVRWSWPRKQGPELVAQVTAAFADGEGICWTVRIRYDPAWRRYRYTFDVDARKLSPEGFEMLNLMMAGALTARPEDRRWTHSIWEDPDGKVRSVVHSNALFSATDYASPAWRTRNAPYHGAWVAYAAHSTFNPAILIHQTTVPLRLATCSQLFDEHVFWSDAGQENIEPDGYFHYRLSAELVNLPPKLAKRLLKEAKDPVRPDRWREQSVALPFAMETVNSFEKPVDPWEAEECPILVVPAGKDASIRWATDAAHTGRRSIRLEARQWSERQEFFPTGAVCNVKPHQRYRLTGWIRTKGVKRYARLTLSSYEYGYTNVVDWARTPDLSGTTDWTEVSVELDSGDEAYLMPRLVLYGPGVAWFDDIMLAGC